MLPGIVESQNTISSQRRKKEWFKIITERILVTLIVATKYIVRWNANFSPCLNCVVTQFLVFDSLTIISTTSFEGYDARCDTKGSLKAGSYWTYSYFSDNVYKLKEWWRTAAEKRVFNLFKRACERSGNSCTPICSYIHLYYKIRCVALVCKY